MRGAGVIAILAVLAAPAVAQQRLDPEEFIRQAVEDNRADGEFGRMIRNDPALPQGVHRVGQALARTADDLRDRLDLLAAENQIPVGSDLGQQDRLMIEKLSRIQGEEFVREYLQFVLNDLERDVQTYKEAAAGQSPDVAKFAADTLPALESNLALVRKAWEEQVAGGLNDAEIEAR